MRTILNHNRGKAMTDMLQKSENVAKNVANKNSQDLTECWKRGEFIICNAGKCQYYYVRNEEQQEVIKTEYCLFDDNTPNWQILAPVPSYDELENMNEAVNQALAANIKLVEENKRLKHDVGNLGYKIKNQRHEIDNRLKEIEKLKELLKECEEKILLMDFDSIKIEILQKIDEVLK